MNIIKRTYTIVTVLVGVVTIAVCGLVVWQRHEITGWVLGTQAQRSEHRIGFVPYWSFHEMDAYPYTHLTEIIYFGVTVDEDGSFIRENDGKPDLGWARLYSDRFNTVRRLAHQNNTKVSVALKPKKTEHIGAIVRSPEAQKTLRQEIKRLIILRNLDGINIDFEFAHGDAGELSDQYFLFLAELFTSLRAEFPDRIFSFDEFPNTIVHANEEAVSQALAASDYYLIMGYDFHAGRSGNTGPVAPVGGEDGGVNSLEGTLAFASKKYPMAEFVLGIPLYGYQWQTVSEEPRSQVVPNTAAVVNYDYTKDFPQNAVQWDDVAQSPWYFYVKDGNHYQVYFENDRSLQEKVQLSREYGLSGVAYWSIDMVAASPEVWTALQGE